MPQIGHSSASGHRLDPGGHHRGGKAWGIASQMSGVSKPDVRQPPVYRLNPLDSSSGAGVRLPADEEGEVT